MLEPLPVDLVLPAVREALRRHPACVLVAPTGAGKTTRLPPALLDAGDGRVVVLEPRRLAARAAARRVAWERGSAVGEEVGYHVRFDRRTSARTRILFATEGVFVRRLLDDPFLDGVGAIVLDEFHERSLDVDLALAMVRRIQSEVRDDLKLVVTSATLDAPALASYLGDVPIVRSEGRLHPVRIEHSPPLPGERETEHVVRGVRQALAETPGDLLVFLPGLGEIRRVGTALADTARLRGLSLHELYGDLSPEAQDAALLRGATRKLVLATNVAESSVTVAGVTGVVDTGFARSLRHDPRLGLDRLERVRISLASADQRAGRAGREAPGTCVRLWSPIDERSMAPFDEPEIRRADLARVVLQLYLWGERDLSRFPWLEAPREESLARALTLLRDLGAVDGQGLTTLGRTLVRLPTHPRLARLLVVGHAKGALRRSALAAALLSERDPWRRAQASECAGHVSDSDVLDRVEALEAFARGGKGAAPELAPAGARAVLAAGRQLERLAAELLGPAEGETQESGEVLLRGLLAAFPDRLARRRADDPGRGVLIGGRGVRLARESAVTEGELFVAVRLDAGKGEGLVRLASRVERAWIDGGATRIELAAVFDAAKERVIAKQRLLLGSVHGGLVLEESDAPVTDPEAVLSVLVEAARADLARALRLDRPEIAGFLGRVACLRAWMPELELPLLDEAEIASDLPALAVGCRSFDDLRKQSLVRHLAQRLTPAQRSALEREAPERLRVPSGSAIQLVYAAGRPPVLAARIQELFGLAETPRLAAGRVPVLVHLLAPNGRPQQITEDLASFWRGAYFDVRKELRRRYPKHAWPDDPRNAVAERRPARGRRGPRR